MMSVWLTTELRNITKLIFSLLLTARLRDTSNFESKQKAHLTCIQAYTVNSSFDMIY